MSVASSKALAKVEDPKRREEEPGSNKQRDPFTGERKKELTEEERQQMEHDYVERRKQNKKQLIEVFFDDNNNGRKETQAPVANLAEMFNAKRKLSGMKSAAAVDQDEAAMSSNQPKQQRRVKTREELADLRKQMMKRPSQTVTITESAKPKSKQETEVPETTAQD